jgi:hypothetical protein
VKQRASSLKGRTDWQTLSQNNQKKERKRDNNKVNKIGDKKGDITTEISEIQRIFREYFVNL